MRGPRSTTKIHLWGTLYKARQGLERTVENADLVVDEIKAAGAIDPELPLRKAVVKHARDDANPLHGFFTWEDGEAAEHWREEQARDLMRGIKVVVVTYLDDGTAAEGTPVPVFASVTLPDAGRRYHETTVLTSTDEGRGALLREAQQQLAQFRNRFAACAELADVMRVIDRYLGGDG